MMLISFQNWARSNVDIFKLQDEFYSNAYDQSDKFILILGSSEVANMNMTYVQNTISQHNPDYQIYNLGTAADVPTTRLQTIDKIIALHPKMVIYGIGIRDFMEKSDIQLHLDKPENPLPEINQIPNPFNIDGTQLNLESPKFLSLKVIDNFLFTVLGISNDDNIIKDRTPFYLHGKDVYEIKNSSFIESDFHKRPALRYVDPPDSNVELFALQQIIKKLQDNDIKIVFFTTPKARIYFDSLGEEQKQTFDSILDELEKNRISIYRLDDKYADMNIWFDYRHVAIDKQGLIYSKDVSEIIKKELSLN